MANRIASYFQAVAPRDEPPRSVGVKFLQFHVIQPTPEMFIEIEAGTFACLPSELAETLAAARIAEIVPPEDVTPYQESR